MISFGVEITSGLKVHTPSTERFKTFISVVIIKKKTTHIYLLTAGVLVVACGV